MKFKFYWHGKPPRGWEVYAPAAMRFKSDFWYERLLTIGRFSVYVYRRVERDEK